MEAEVLFEVEAGGRDLGMIRGSICSVEKIFKLHKGKFLTLSQAMSEGECFFAQMATFLQIVVENWDLLLENGVLMLENGV